MTNSKTFHTKTLPELQERLRILDANIRALEEGRKRAKKEERDIQDLLDEDPIRHKFDVKALRENLTRCVENVARIDAVIEKEKEAKLAGHRMIEEARERDELLEASMVEIDLINRPASDEE
jgi:polyhydroxyalkanoate synthesis regulator phasin